MANLVDIARRIKSTFDGFEVVGSIQKDLDRIRNKYGDAEPIHIGEMDYIVINGVYRTDETEGMGKISPLFFNSINNSYAIIDTETSSTLIDEVYSRITYMQRICLSEGYPTTEEIVRTLSEFIADDTKVKVDAVIVEDDEQGGNRANIFQCHLIKNTGVSATPDVYSFMLKNGVIKEIAESVLRQVRKTGEVRLVSDRDTIDNHKKAIQSAVFNKFRESDVDIQDINIRSIFEIIMSFTTVYLICKDEAGRNSSFHTIFLPGDDSSYINENIHVCDTCGHDLVDVRDAEKRFKIHTNTDAIDPELSTDDQIVYATGCDDCLEQCPKCGGWHFNYQKFIGSPVYSKIKTAPGRAFIKGLRDLGDLNYCSCREGIEWVYDEKSGTEEEHGVIPIEKMALVNYVGEQLAGYKEFQKFCKRQGGRKKNLDGNAEHKLAVENLRRFRKKCADDLQMDVKDIRITSADRCILCPSCHGRFYTAGRTLANDENETLCSVCAKMDSESVNIVTRMDGVIFMRRRIGKNRTINKYVITTLGLLKKLPNRTINIEPAETTDETDLPEEEVTTEISGAETTGEESAAPEKAAPSATPSTPAPKAPSGNTGAQKFGQSSKKSGGQQHKAGNSMRKGKHRHG